MNCALIKVTDGFNKRDTYLNKIDHAILDLSSRDIPSFLNIFIANISAIDCIITKVKDIQFLNAGVSVERDNVTSDLTPLIELKCDVLGELSLLLLSDFSSGLLGASATPLVAPLADATLSLLVVVVPSPPSASASFAAVPVDILFLLFGSLGSVYSSFDELIYSLDGTQFAICAAGGIAATF